MNKADISPVFRKENHMIKLLTGSILLWLSKVYECLIYNQLNHGKKCLIDISVWFSQKIYTHHSLVTSVEKGRKIFDKGGTFGTILTDLSKSFNCMT